MELERQVCSIGMAKKLKELGVKQDSYYLYFMNKNLEKYIILPSSGCSKKYYIEDNYYSAFSIAELSEMLPKDIIQNDVLYRLTIRKGDTWTIMYLNYLNQGIEFGASTDNLADAMAKMMILLIKKQFIKKVD